MLNIKTYKKSNTKLKKERKYYMYGFIPSSKYSNKNFRV